MKHDRRAVDSLAPQQMPSAPRWNRRTFVKRLAALAASAPLFGHDVLPAMADPPPETTRIRLIRTPAICVAPQYLAEQLLRLEGFSQIEYVEQSATQSTSAFLATGQVDMSMDAAPSLVFALGEGKHVVALAGIHAGCYELFASASVRAVKDLRGKRVAISALGSPEHVFVASMAAYVGMNPRTEIEWLAAGSGADAMRLFADGEADAFMGFAPQPQELRARKVGRVIVNTTQDRPWSKYFCCMVTGNQEFVQKYPIATKRALRAILKSADICAEDPQRAARLVVTKGFEPDYSIALEVLKGLPYRMWRDSNPEDTLRFHTLRLHEVGMIKLEPKKLITQGTNWRFLNELKEELKA
jgi:NitT/TauT family transport system substrate-binding protein